jgi:Zn-dependent peptidase ImmA (M78 family)/DNA-binding XRE family transcriptional regulator
MDVKQIAILREQQRLTQGELGDKIGVTRQTIAVWERGERIPTVAQFHLIAKALDVALQVFLNAKPVTTEPTLLFRADDRQALTETLKEVVRLKADTYAFLEQELQEIAPLPPSYPLEDYNTILIERIAREIRDFLGVENAPIGDVIALLEEKGIKVLLLGLPDTVSGFSAFTEEWGAVIVINDRHDLARQYFTALHELAHLICHRKDYAQNTIPARFDPKEKIANHLAGAILLPREMLEYRLRGYQNKWIPEVLLGEMKLRFSASMRTILTRASQLGIITAAQKGQQIGKLNKVWGKTIEPFELQRIELKAKEQAVNNRLERLTYQALSREYITHSRAAEILGVSLLEVRQKSRAWEQEA